MVIVRELTTIFNRLVNVCAYKSMHRNRLYAVFRIRPDPKLFGLKDPDPKLLISDPDPSLFHTKLRKRL